MMKRVLTVLVPLFVSAAGAVETNSVAVVTNSAVVTNAVAPARATTVFGRPEGWRISTKTYKLNHVNATEVAEKFNEVWGGDFGQQWKVQKMAVAFEESNTLMMTAPGQILEACEKTLMELDVEAQQVYIEARFVELGNNASHKVGIDWSMLGGMKGTVGLGGGIQQYNLGSRVSDFTRRSEPGDHPREQFSISGDRGSDGSIAYFRGTLDFSDMYLILKALDETEDTKTFSNPKIIVSSGKMAKVDMTTKYPNVQIATKRTLNGNSDSIDLDMKMAAIPGEDKFMFAKEAFFSWGISLDVTPRIGTNGLINVQIVPTISTCSEFVSAADSAGESGAYTAKYPVIDMKRLITEFNMKSGETAVIGGLSKTEERQVENGIPVLRSIPWIGPLLFGSMERVKEQREIIVFVTVGLVDPNHMKPDAGLPKNAVLGRQYVKGQKLEPGDRPARSMEGQESLDLRPLEEQARDPLNTATDEKGFSFSQFIPFTKDSNRKKDDSQ